MLEQYYVKPSTIDRIRANWLAPQIEGYVQWMHNSGYADRSVYRRVPILCQFADFAREHGATDLASASLHVEAFASHWLAPELPAFGRRSRKLNGRFWSACGNGISPGEAELSIQPSRP